MLYPYRSAAMGGTFDRLHDGHEQLLDTAFLSAERVCIGITHDDFLSEKHLASLVEPYAVRRQSVEQYLRRFGLLDRARIVALHDVAGPTLLPEEDFDVLVVSVQTQQGAEAIHVAREHMGLRRLSVVVADMVCDAEGAYISSTRIRAGEISRHGVRYSSVFDQDIDLARAALDELAKPQGELLTADELQSMGRDILDSLSVVVGDSTLELFLQYGLQVDHACIDHKSKRMPYAPELYGWVPQAVYGADNKPHGISAAAARVVAGSVEESTSIVCIDGEEDLLALVYVLLLPLESRVFYGQPDEGVVMMRVTESLKEKLYSYVCS